MDPRARLERVLASRSRCGIAVIFAIATFGVAFAWVVRQRRKSREELEKWTAIAAALGDEPQP